MVEGRHLEIPTFTNVAVAEEYVTTNSSIGNHTPSGMCSAPDYDLTKHRIIPVFYLILCVVGVLGNGVVIKVLWTLMDKNNIKSVTDILVLNLAVADFIFVSSLPFWATEQFLQNRWVFGTVGCKLLSFITLLNLYGSVFFLVAMGIDRYLAVVFAVRARNYRTPRNAKMFCAIIWMFASLIGVEALVLRDTNVTKCLTKCVWQLPPGPGWNEAFFVLRVLFGFALPFIVLVYCYVFIMIRLSKMAKSSRVQGSVTSNQQKITRAILAVISLFVVCWLPNHIITVMIAITMNDREAAQRLHLNIANLFSVCLAYTNSSINPILYAFMKTEIREEGTKLFQKLYCFRNEEKRTKNNDTNDRVVQHKPRTLRDKFAAFKQNLRSHNGNHNPNTITTTVKSKPMENEPLCDQNSNLTGSPQTPPNDHNTVVLMVTTVNE